MLANEPSSSSLPGAMLGLTILCRPDGQILEVIRDDFGLAPQGSEPCLQQMVDMGSIEKLENFLDELRQQGSAFGWELNLFHQGRLTPIHFAGGTTREKMLILAARNRTDIFTLYQQLIHTRPDFVDSLQNNIIGQAALAQTQIDRDSASFDDLTDLNNQLANLQRELAKKNIELERLNQLKNQFVGMAAHDLRNPLQAIQSYCEILLDERNLASPQEHAEFLTDIHALSKFMLGMVNNLLSVSAIESGQLRLDLRQVDLAALLQKNIARNRLLAARKQIDLALEIEAVPPLLLDPARIEQVLDNLIGNAVKFSAPGTRVSVRLLQEERGILITVQDQGPGIAAAEMEKLFKPFGRASSRTTGGERSTGLGLVIVKRIVEGHGATIWIESAPGQGSTFFVCFPLKQAEAQQE